MPESVYIHIPFCKSKCKYCSFVSFNKPELISSYTQALLSEIDKFYNNEPLKTLYLGGGTPSLLSPDILKKILSRFNMPSDTEITLELNPDDASLEYLENLHAIGINRLSIGSQTFDDKILKTIGRRHSSCDIKESVLIAKQAGFKNISLDLIYGLPGQTIESLKQDLEKFLELKIQHISTYGLKIEEGSAWFKNPPEIPEDDTQADMYELINNILEKQGIIRYEVSNFAKKGYESKHNLNYWNNEEYYGFGTAAHGYINGIRYSNFQTIEEYIKNPFSHDKEKILTNNEKLEEEIFLGFRKRDGINKKKIKNKYGIDFEKKYRPILEKYADFIAKTPSGYCLNLQGVLLSNVILAEFMETDFN